MFGRDVEVLPGEWKLKDGELVFEKPQPIFADRGGNVTSGGSSG